MSLPKFPEVPEGYTINDSIAQIITSIAMEEIGLSHIINAEGEKIQYILGTLEGGAQPQERPPTFEQILELNESVKDMLSQVSFSQMFLMGKMQAALNAYQPTAPKPPQPLDRSKLIIGGTGRDTLIAGSLSASLVQFSPQAILQIGNDITLDPTTQSQVNINRAGTHQINYQLALYPAADAADSSSLDVIAELTSASLGVIDSIHFTPNNPLQQSSLTIQLPIEDTLSIVLRNQEGSDFYISSQVATFATIDE